MVSMGDIWDRTTDVLNGRVGMLAPVGLLGIYLPQLGANALTAFGQPISPMGALALLFVTFAALVITLWGQLTVIAIASDPATTRAQATTHARDRLGAGVAVAVVVAIAVMLLFMPAAIAYYYSGAGFRMAGAGVAMPPLGNAFRFGAIWSVVATIALIAVLPRLALVNPVLLHEPVSLGALTRSWGLTRGFAWRLIGVMVLYGIVLLITSMAVRLVGGLVVRLLVGSNAPAAVAFITQMLSGLVTTGFTVIAAVFVAQLYVALRGTPATA